MIELRRVWWIVAIVFAAAYAFVTPPFQVPDEVGHYWHAQAIASGDFIPRQVNGMPTAFVARGAKELVAALWVPTAGRPDLKVGLDRIRAAWRVELQKSDRVAATFPAYYTPVPYAVTAIVLAAANVFDVRPLIVFYAGRLANAAAMLLLIFVGARRTPIVAAISLVPMVLFLGGSSSADAITIGLASYVAALALRPEERTPQLVLASALLALCKPVYFLLPLVAAARLRGRRLIALIAVIAICVTISAWIAQREHFVMRHDTPINPRAQMRFVAAHPIHFASIVIHDYRDRAIDYADQLTGRLGWLDVDLPHFLLRLTLSLLFVVALLTPADVGWPARIVGIAIVVATSIGISLSQYMVWSTVSGDTIEGIQGRYFLPVVSLLLAIIGTRSSRFTRVAELIFTISAAALNVAGIAALLHRYY